MSVGTLALGLLNGLTIGLLAVGLVLVYKSNRFLNLAHAQLGTLSALLLAKLVLDRGWNWWVAFSLAVVVGVVSALVVDRLFVAPLKRRGGSSVRLVLLSLAVSQLLLAFTFIPALEPNPERASLYPQPFVSQLQVGGVVLSGMWVLTAVLVPVLVAGLAVFMRYSLLGRQIRAAANNPDAARLCGISVARVSTITWGMAGGLAAVSAVLQAPTQARFSVAALGPYLLMLTLGAAAFGAFVSLPAALGGGLVLGLLIQIVSTQTSSGTAAELAVFAAILLVVFVRGKAISKVFAIAGGVGIGEALPVTRVPEVLRSSPLVRYQRWWLWALGGVVALVAPNLPYFNRKGNQFLLSLILIYALLGVGLTMLIGWAGQISLGHFGVVGLAAFLAARLSANGWSLPAVMVVAGLIGAAVMVVVGLPALRVGGLTLAVTTMGFAVIASDWLLHQNWAGSSLEFESIPPLRLGPGLGTPRSELAIYYVALGVLVLGVAAAGALRRLGPGRLVMAVRDNDRAAAAFGIVPATTKLAILAVSGLFAGVAGVMFGLAWGVASHGLFAPQLSVALVALPVIGGLGSLGGAVVAAVALYAGAFFTGPALSSIFGEFGASQGFQLFLAGIGQLTVLLQFPTGIAGQVQARWQGYLDRRAGLAAATGMAQAGPAPAPEAEVALAEPGGLAEVLATAKLPQPARPGPAASAQEAAGAPEGDGQVLPLVTDGLRLRFGGVVALDSPDICVRSGEIVGLIGSNGAGKSTLINVISGVASPEAGSVRIFGQEVTDLPADFRAPLGVARSFQDAGLFAGLTVTETIQVALAYRNKVGMVSAMVRAPWVLATEWRSAWQASQIVERFGLGPWAEALNSELSTGTRRICDLAAQVAAGPKLLLLDEPTAGVAQREAEAFGPLLRAIREELDCSVLIVEHDMPLLMGLCDRVYAMESGRVIAEGTPEQIRSNPAVIASYLGSEEMAISRSGARSPSRARRGRGRGA